MSYIVLNFGKAERAILDETEKLFSLFYFTEVTQ